MTKASGRPEMIAPPSWRTADGAERHIGLEIEFANLSSSRAAELVRQRFGGRIEEHDPHDYRVIGSAFGAFKIELDTQYAHPTARDPGAGEDGATDRLEADLAAALEREVARTVGDIGSLWLPVEIVSPPVPLSRLPDLDAIVDDLRAAGAEGTDEGLLSAFATQLNLEVPSPEPASILSHLRAFILQSASLRAEIDLDVKRRLLPFADPFPRAYAADVLDPAYDPDLPRLIDDYLAANPTRNRELDLLPLFAHLDEKRVRAAIDDPRIKARPTFHYRLPDTRLQDPRWGAVTEWNRWVRVEQLAADADALKAAMRAYRSRPDGASPGEWLDAVAGLFK